MQNDNKSKNTKKKMAEKEDATGSTATMTKAILTPTTITDEKEDDTDLTSVCASEWDDDITEALEDSTALNDQIYRWIADQRDAHEKNSFPANQKGCDNSETTVGKLLAFRSVGSIFL